jgi:hypothetical protein
MDYLGLSGCMERILKNALFYVVRTGRFLNPVVKRCRAYRGSGQKAFAFERERWLPAMKTFSLGPEIKSKSMFRWKSCIAVLVTLPLLFSCYKVEPDNMELPDRPFVLEREEFHLRIQPHGENLNLFSAEIYRYDTLFLKYDHVPGVRYRLPFINLAQAIGVGQLIIRRYKEGHMPYYFLEKELDSLKLLPPKKTKPKAPEVPLPAPNGEDGLFGQDFRKSNPAHLFTT